METINAFLNNVIDTPFDINIRYSIFYVFCTVLIAFGIWKYRGSPDTFVRWLIPKEVYCHKSNMLDIKLFFAYRVFTVLGIMGAVFFPTTVAFTLVAHLAGNDFSPPPITWTRTFLVTLIIVVVSDFCKYRAHQVHHSVACKHHDKNYGSIFAIWDWMFGTLYIPPTEEKLTFGVSDGTDKPMAQPYPTLRAVLINPFKESWAALRTQSTGDIRLTQTLTPMAHG